MLEGRTVAQNLEIIQKKSRTEISVEDALEIVGLANSIDTKVYKLSGGEQQRTAIARALSTDPEIIMADEPTGNLDHETSGEIIELLMRLAHERDKCVIVVTHDLKIAEKSDVILQLDTEKKAFTVKHNMTG